MRHYSDPTASRALGAVQREWLQMARLALRLRTGRCAPDDGALAARFTGIYRRLLTDPLEEVERLARNR